MMKKTRKKQNSLIDFLLDVNDQNVLSMGFTIINTSTAPAVIICIGKRYIQFSLFTNDVRWF